eukprot:CAMPEP_0177634108 /NCGR_PEP_ID=MMETSP0447-20121125/3194_1 /TAXON_ID=0 /ORGANISM="Stygamoeba regulata, Strain BSH-02190019" /LENGTH=254 /DNA_ID=CAMNT_0019135811 /DNA_START=213 /DNA_END=977 /DNA_ORIENTATION=-
MPGQLSAVTDETKNWVLEQPLFFVGSAPLSASGHVNISPKGLDGTLTFIDPAVLPSLASVPDAPSATPLAVVAYLDIGGSGVETVSHMQENGRLVLMWLSFGEKPRILRFWGKGYFVEPSHPDFPLLADHFPLSARETFKAMGPADQVKTRNIVFMVVERAADSCGYGVPKMKFEAHRAIFPEKFATQSKEKYDDYRQRKNSYSIDGLPGLPSALERTWAMELAAVPAHPVAANISKLLSVGGFVLALGLMFMQ